MTNADKFLEIFNRIELYLSKECKINHKPFMDMVYELKNKNSVIRVSSDDLREYAELRNAIVHKSLEKSIAEPYQETIDSIEKLYNTLIEPPTVYQKAIKPVHINKTTDLIADAVKIMKEKIYTHIPILDEKDNFMGVFSESTIIKWLADSVEKDGFILEKIYINDIQKHLDIEGDKFNTYRFVPRDMNIFDVQDIFLDSISKKERLGAIFVTQNGSVKESILGIITAWDLPNINNLQ